MPIFKNISDKVKSVLTDKNGSLIINPGESFDTWADYRYDLDFKLTNNTIFNPIIAKHDTLAGTTFEVNVLPETEIVVIYNANGNPFVTMQRGTDVDALGETIPPDTLKQIPVRILSVGGKLTFTSPLEIVAGTFIVEEQYASPV